MANLWLAALAIGGVGALDEDRDNDGLKDRWEIEGHGPIDPKVHKVSPDRADVFIVFRMRSTMTREKIQPTIDRVVKFFADLPYSNRDGSRGLNAIPIVPPPMPADTDKKGYIELYGQAMPEEWRGYAHGILLDDHPGGGGQANRPDWAGTGYNWQTIVHELGHQFGLGHTPRGNSAGSPFHTSLMNYDYSYQFNGDGNAIHYSSGKFNRMRMKENALQETVPYPAKDLEFLTKRPYFFKVKAIDDRTSAIDWNRNGIFGERNVRADVNDGYALEFRRLFTLEATAGTPALASNGRDLALAVPESETVPMPPSLSSARMGSITLRLARDGKLLPKRVVHDMATGDPSIAWSSGRWVLAFPTHTGFELRQYRPDGDGFKEVRSRAVDFPPCDVTVTDSGYGPLILVRERASGDGYLMPLSGSEPVRIPVQSSQPLAAVWNSKAHRLAVVEVVDQGERKGRMRIAHLDERSREWLVTDRQWVEGERGNAATSARPVILFDATRDRGPNGAYNIYCKGYNADPNARAVNFVCRQIQDPTMGDGWRIRMMGNEWAISQNPPAATLHRGDVAYAYRLGFSANETKLVLSLNASGVENAWLEDMDEVKFIMEQGLKESLRAVQRERGIQ